MRFAFWKLVCEVVRNCFGEVCVGLGFESGPGNRNVDSGHRGQLHYILRHRWGMQLSNSSIS